MHRILSRSGHSIVMALTERESKLTYAALVLLCRTASVYSSR